MTTCKHCGEDIEDFFKIKDYPVFVHVKTQSNYCRFEDKKAEPVEGGGKG
jgi:hypothetical protein